MINEGYLAHHQIKGAKHGVRRFQNYDGSYTAAGRARYGIGIGNTVYGYTDSGSEQRGATKSAYVQKPLGSEARRSAAATLDTSEQRRMLSGNDNPYINLPGYGMPGHSYRQISKEEYDQINASKTAKAEATVSDIVTNSAATATPQTVQSSVAAGKKLVSKITKKKTKPVKRISTNSSRTLNEKTKNLTDLKRDQPNLRGIFEQ